MSRFKVGQKVIALKNHTQGAFKKGVIYTVYGVKFNCCYHAIDIGVIPIHNMGMCECGTLIRNIDNKWWFFERGFSPLEDDGCSKELVEEFIEEKEKELELN